jgi:hypothetical protein
MIPSSSLGRRQQGLARFELDRLETSIGDVA